MTYDLSDRNAVERRAKEHKAVRKNTLNFLRNCMQSSEGRDYFYSLLSTCHCFHSPFKPGHADVTAFNAGEQNIGLRIMADLVEASPELYLKMLGEQNERVNSHPGTGSGDRPGNDRQSFGYGTDPDSLAGHPGSGDE